MAPTSPASKTHKAGLSYRHVKLENHHRILAYKQHLEVPPKVPKKSHKESPNAPSPKSLG